ncbi:MAG: putative capsular polysaccharide synthesis family protein [Dolichospermum sp.]
MNTVIKFLREKNIDKKNLRKLIARIIKPKMYWSLKDNIYLVYTMGKVGSSTIYKTLETELKVAHVFHVHRLSRKWLETRDLSISDNHPSVRQAKQIQKLKSTPGKHFKIISIVRDPIAKKVSGFFQNPHLYGLTQQDLLTISPDDACNLIIQNRMKFYDTVEWFDNEFADFTGIDIYEKSFNHADKEQVCSSDNLDVLILRLEDFKYQETILLNLQRFIESPIQKITNANITEEKPFATLNKQVVDMIKFPDDFVNDIYSSKYCQHFYTPDELHKFRNKWTGAKVR